MPELDTAAEARFARIIDLCVAVFKVCPSCSCLRAPLCLRLALSSAARSPKATPPPLALRQHVFAHFALLASRRAAAALTAWPCSAAGHPHPLCTHPLRWLQVPIAVVGLIDIDHIALKAAVGTAMPAARQLHSFCEVRPPP